MTKPRRHQRRPHDGWRAAPATAQQPSRASTPIIPLPPLTADATEDEILDRMCRSHVYYPSQMVAENAATAMNWTGRGEQVPFTAYDCSHCDGWHIGQDRRGAVS